MRKLKTSDIPVFCRCIKKLGVKDRIWAIYKEAGLAKESDSAEGTAAKDIIDKGFEILWEVFDIATEQHGEAIIYEFFAGPFEMTPEEFSNLDFDALIDGLKQLAAENNLQGFFGSAAKLMK